MDVADAREHSRVPHSEVARDAHLNHNFSFTNSDGVGYYLMGVVWGTQNHF